MAKADAAAKDKGAEQTAEASNGNQGVAVVLPNGERRIDFIRNSYYSDKAPFAHTEGEQKSRSAIKNEINEMYKAAGEEGKQIAYQIVFSATKEKTDPRKKVAATETPAAS